MRSLAAVANDGVALHAQDWGPDGAPLPVVCLPGLTRNARDFTALADALSRDDDAGSAMRVIVLESRGRGQSGRAAPDTYTLPQELDDLTRALDAWGVKRAHFVGTSRGGLLTMLLAMTAPERIESAVLNDIGPRIEPEGLARIAGSVGATMRFASFEALGAHLKATLGTQFTDLDAGGWLRFARQLASEDTAGSVRLDYDERLGDTFRDAPPSDETPDFWPAFEALAAVPVLVIRGANSDLLSAATVEAMRRHDPRVQSLIVHGEGHAPLLWDRRSIDTVKRFLARS